MKNLLTYKLFESSSVKITKEFVFDSIPWQDNHKDLYPGYSEKPNEFTEEYYFDSKEQADQFAEELIGILDGLPDPIPLYRSIKAGREEDIDLEFPGESWSYDRDSAYNFGRHNGSNFMLTAKVNKKDVNWMGTVKAYVLFSGGFTDDDENEIVVDDAEKLIDMKIEPLRKK